ncbi:MAG: SEC-C metal-binding domain-containing protein [Actinomycetota bacterium]|nr:SEC-C metal-binding domain-containing protein [Actinomycetota bacterium]
MSVAISCVLVVDPFAGVTEDVRDALAGVPETERALLELRLSWPALGEREALIAARLRVFVLTWEPLGWMRDRDTAWATATGDGDSYEVVLYLMLHDAVRRARETARTLADVIGELAGSVLAVGAIHEELLVSGAYPQLAFAGELPGLLSELGSAHGLPAPEIELAASAWEPIGLGAIQDLAQERYGPVDLDRSKVRLDPATELTPDCPACMGGRFGFPAELDEQRAGMCAEHADQAQRIITERLERAPASNRDGWDAIVGGSSMLSEPTFGLPLWLLGGLQNAADRDRRTQASESELRADAELALELAARLSGKPKVFAELISVDGIGDTWLIELPMALAWRGLVDEAVKVGDALAGLDQDNRAMFANDVAAILAETGRGDEALARVEQNLRRFPEDLWTQIHAGDVHLALSDLERAEQAFRDALAMALARGDASGVADANERLVRLLTGQPGREQEANAAAQEMQRASRAAYGGSRVAVKIGRNDSCPCGSGRKYKRCCGAG